MGLFFFFLVWVFSDGGCNRDFHETILKAGLYCKSI